MVINLEAKKRDIKENLENLKKEGYIPAVYYGKKTKSTPISISLKNFKKVWKEVGESTIFNLDTEKGKLDVLINDVDKHPVSEEPRHADFYVVEKGQTIKVKVPLVFIGESPAVKNLGGLLVKVLHELELEGSPKDIPQEIEVNISSITDFDINISVKDLKPISDVKIIEDMEETIAMVSEPKEEEEEKSDVSMDSIEVEKKPARQSPDGSSRMAGGGKEEKTEEGDSKKPEESK